MVGDDGREVLPNGKEVGEIIVKGDTVTPGYWNRREETDQVFKNGWLYTGDMAVIDKEGYINIVDRKKDMILTGGENVYSTEVENILYMHPGILEAAVCGDSGCALGRSRKGLCGPETGLELDRGGYHQFL